MGGMGGCRRASGIYSLGARATCVRRTPSGRDASQRTGQAQRRSTTVPVGVRNLTATRHFGGGPFRSSRTRVAISPRCAMPGTSKLIMRSSPRCVHGRSFGVPSSSGPEQTDRPAQRRGYWPPNSNSPPKLCPHAPHFHFCSGQQPVCQIQGAVGGTAMKPAMVRMVQCAEHAGQDG